MKRFGIATSGLMMIDGEPLYESLRSNKNTGRVSVFDRYFDDFYQVILNDLFSDDRWRSMSISTYCGSVHDSSDPNDDTFVFDVWLNLDKMQRAHICLMRNDSDLKVRFYNGSSAYRRIDIPLVRYNGELAGVIPTILDGEYCG